MKEIILLLNNLLIVAHCDPGPVDIPLNKLPQYYAERDKNARVNHIPYDTYGPPPDLYPAIIPQGLSAIDEYDYYNITYPGPYVEYKGCNSVDSCPINPSDPHAPGFGIGPGSMGFSTDAETSREWKCHVETDCYGLSEVPSDIQNNTEVLFLRSFNFTTLQDGDLSSLPSLIKLRIEYCDLETIQAGAFEPQKKLQYLELVANRIDELQPRTFAELSELTDLDLSSNRLSAVSRETFEGLSSLVTLDMGENGLTGIENDTFRGAPLLQTIKIESNKITTLARYAFRGLKYLTTLKLGHNLFTKVPNIGLRSVTSLTSLHLSGNRFSSITKADFRFLRKLKEIWVDQCEISSIARRTFQGLNLTLLDISANELVNVRNLGDIGTHVTLQMGLNPWRCDCALMKTTGWLREFDITLSSPEPICKSPRYFAGRKITRVTNEELCGPPPKYPPPTTRGVMEVITRMPRDKTNDIGGWSNKVYDIAKLYTILSPTTQTTTRLSTSQSTEVSTDLPHSTMTTKHIQTTQDQSFQTASATNSPKIELTSQLPEEKEVEASTVLVFTIMMKTLRNIAVFTSPTENPPETDPSELVKVILIVLSVTILVSFALVFIVYRCSSNKNRIEETDLEMPAVKIKLENTEYVNGNTVVCTEKVTNDHDGMPEKATNVEDNGLPSQSDESDVKKEAPNPDDDETTNPEADNDVKNEEEDGAEENHTNDAETASRQENATTAPSEKENIGKESENTNNDSISKEVDSKE